MIEITMLEYEILVYKDEFPVSDSILTRFVCFLKKNSLSSYPFLSETGMRLRV